MKRKMYQYDTEDLKKALSEIRAKNMKIREACRRFNVPKTTLLDRLSGRVPDKLRKPGPPPLLTVEGEERIKNWVINLAKCGFPVKKEMLINTVSKIASETNPELFKNGVPQQTWYLNFLKRNPEISLKEAESINKARAIVTEESIRKWFRELVQFLTERDLLNILTDDPRRVLNGDETGFSLCPKTGKVLGPKGFKNLYQVHQGNEKENVTVLITFNAEGKCAPPLVLFPYIRPPRALVNSMPTDWVLGRSEKGWMTSEVFFEYLCNDFNKWLLSENIPRPIILFVDGHKSHLSMTTSQWCDENQIILYALPPNTTHILQPADVSVFRAMKADWKKTIRLWQSRPENINSSVTKMNFCSIFNEVLADRTDFAIKVQNGFRKCGLFPLNPSAVDYTKCVLNNSEKIKITQSNLKTRRSSETVSQRDIRSAKKVINKIKSNLESYGLNVDVIMNEIDCLGEATVTPRKSSEGNKENSAALTSGNQSDIHKAISQSNSMNVNEIDITDISLPSCFTTSVVNDLRNEVIPVIDISDPFMNFDFITSSVNHTIEENTAFMETASIHLGGRDENFNINPEYENNLKSASYNETLMSVAETTGQPFEILTDNEIQIYRPSLHQAFDNHLTYPNTIKKSIKTNRKNMGTAPSAISSDRWREFYKKKDEEQQKKNMEIQRRKEERKRIKEINNNKKRLTKEKKPITAAEIPATSRKMNKIPCALCEESLNSDTEDDDKKNIGCDFCENWFHKKCTEFTDIPYSEAAAKDYKCDLC